MKRYCSPQGCRLCLTAPAEEGQLDGLAVVEGVTFPYETVMITIDRNPPLFATADGCGAFSVDNPYSLSTGIHQICAISRPSGCCIRHYFYICLPQPVCPCPAPTIDTPANGSVIDGSSSLITGRGVPGYTVRVCLSGHGCREAVVGADGQYRVNFGVPLSQGTYTVTAVQSHPDCGVSCQVSSAFTVGASACLAQPIEARMGRTFRTVDVDVSISSGAGQATVYYLLLPPGSPAPTAEEIMNYRNLGALINGTAATGRFTANLQPGQHLYTWALTGLDSPNAPAGITGVIDGYRYDVYLDVVLPCGDSGVLSFDQTPMGMPYASGLGTPDNPFTIRELTPGELQMYPDLLADNPLNWPGVDETGRMLENIERLITLYERTDGLYGLEDSMALNYLMTSDINLAVYAPAYGGQGWQSIGDIDGWINDEKENEHLFSGVFDGGGHTISNLSITPNADDGYFVGYRGLFGGVEEGTIRSLTLSGVFINAFATPPGQAQLGSFISIARNPVLDGLSLFNARILADIGPISIGDTHAVNVGGFVGEIFDGGRISNIVGQGINITVPDRSALALGGFVGFTDKFEAYESYTNISLSGLTISGHAQIGGLAGYVVYGVNLVSRVTVNQITITAPGGEAGGLIGRLYLYSGTGDCLIENSSAQNVTVLLGAGADPGDDIGGLIGLIRENPFALRSDAARRIFPAAASPVPTAAAAWPMTTIGRCFVSGGQINCSTNGGGLVGRIAVNRAEADGRVLVTECWANIPVSAITDAAGGLVGFAIACTFSDCYALGSCSSGAVAGGIVAIADSSNVTRCYSAGNVAAATAAGGIVGVAFFSALQGNLVLGGVISAATAHRILGLDDGGTTLLGNYALNTVAPSPGVLDPNGLDGGTITTAQIISTMQTLGWNTVSVWNTETVATLNRPTLLANPE